MFYKDSFNTKGPRYFQYTVFIVRAFDSLLVFSFLKSKGTIACVNLMAGHFALIPTWMVHFLSML